MKNAVFQSVGQALAVSYLMEILPVTQKVSTQMLIEWLQQQAGVRPEARESTLNFSGLSPLEVRAQCSLVRAAVEHHLPGPERDVILARFGQQASKARGVSGVAQYCKALTTIESDIALKALAWSIYHPAKRAQDRWSLRDIEAETGVHHNKLQRAGAAIRATGESLRKMAERRLQDLFERTGLVECAGTDANLTNRLTA